MSKSPVTIQLADLQNVYGGRGRGIIEGGRKLLQAGAVAWNTLFPTHPPIKPPPSPPKIERVQPNRAGQSTGGARGGQE